MTDEISLKLKRHRRARPFVLSSSVKDLKKEIGVELPTDEVIKLISLSGGIASLTFIKLVADVEPIEELTASTLRIGEKQFQYLETSSNLNKNPKIEQYSFENNKELCDFYYGFFDKLEERVTANG